MPGWAKPPLFQGREPPGYGKISLLLKAPRASCKTPVIGQKESIFSIECPIINKEYPISKSIVFYRTEWLFHSSLDIPCWILDIQFFGNLIRTSR
jgi:hypothetical protein